MAAINHGGTFYRLDESSQSDDCGEANVMGLASCKQASHVADIAVYSILARILFRKEQEKQQELTELERGKCSTDYGEPRFMSPKHLEPVDDKYNGDESYTHPMIAMREAAEKQQQEEEDTENLRQALQSKIEKEEQRRSDENLAHIKSLMERDKLSDVEKLEVQRMVNKHNNFREDEAKKNEAWLRSQSPKDSGNN